MRMFVGMVRMVVVMGLIMFIGVVFWIEWCGYWC